MILNNKNNFNNKNLENPSDSMVIVKLAYDKKELRSNTVKCLIFALGFLAVLVLGGLVNPDSSHTFWIVFPYLFLYLPVGFDFFGIINLFGADVTMTQKLFNKSIEQIKHSVQALLVLGVINSILDIIYIFKYKDEISISLEIIYLFSLLAVTILSFLFGLLFDKMFINITTENVK